MRRRLAKLASDVREAFAWAQFLLGDPELPGPADWVHAVSCAVERAAGRCAEVSLTFAVAGMRLMRVSREGHAIAEDMRDPVLCGICLFIWGSHICTPSGEEGR